jgi:hypothetical protein
LKEQETLTNLNPKPQIILKTKNMKAEEAHLIASKNNEHYRELMKFIKIEAGGGLFSISLKRSAKYEKLSEALMNEGYSVVVSHTTNTINIYW